MTDRASREPSEWGQGRARYRSVEDMLTEEEHAERKRSPRVYCPEHPRQQMMRLLANVFRCPLEH